MPVSSERCAMISCRGAIHVRPGAMVLELEFLAVVVDGVHRGEARLLSARRGGGGEDRSRHDAGKEVPGLRHEADLDGQLVLADRVQERLQLAEGALRERAGRLEKDLQLDLAVAELERLGRSRVLCRRLRVGHDYPIISRSFW